MAKKTTKKKVTRKKSTRAVAKKAATTKPKQKQKRKLGKKLFKPKKGKNLIKGLVSVAINAGIQKGMNSVFEGRIKKENYMKKNKTTIMNQDGIINENIKDYSFLKDMYHDAYFPDFLVDKGKNILLELCSQIESQKPENLDTLYKLTHAATDKFNELDEEFCKNDSEIETVARDCIGIDFDFIAKAYSFDEADVEELIATRDW